MVYKHFEDMQHGYGLFSVAPAVLLPWRGEVRIERKGFELSRGSKASARGVQGGGENQEVLVVKCVVFVAS